MAWSDYFNGTTGLTYYAKPIPVVESPWATDVVASGAEGFSGEYPFSGLADGVDYAIFIQAGGSPASSDTKDGYLYYRASPADIAAIKAVADAIKAVTDNLPDSGALTSISANASSAATQSAAANTAAAANKKLLEADRISVLIAGVYYERTLERGTGTQLIPDKKIKQTDGATDLVNPITQRYGGAVEE